VNSFFCMGYVCFYFAFFCVCFRENQTKELKVEAFISGVYLLREWGINLKEPNKRGIELMLQLIPCLRLSSVN
jgi:hypothetical protein